MFSKHNPSNDFAKLIEYFSVFGGIKYDINLDNPILDEITDKILKNYKYIHNDICKSTLSDPFVHAVLSGAALGDAQEHTAFKRAKVSNESGKNIIDQMYDKELIKLESSYEELPIESGISERIVFATPFLRFWFAFVSMKFRSIKEGDFSEVKQSYINKQSDFTKLVFVQLCKEYIKQNIDTKHPIQSYWGKSIEIDIIATLSSGEILVGSCKYNDNKIKKSELTKLKENAKTLGIKADIFVIFGKNGFSKELKSMKSDSVYLFKLNSLKSLIKQ